MATQPNNEMRSNMSLLQLNQHCLLEIFSYFSKFELIRARGICPQLDEIICSLLRRCKRMFIDFRFHEFGNQGENLLNGKVAYHLESLHLLIGFKFTREESFHLLSPIGGCKHLKHLTINWTTLHSDILNIIKTISNNLEKIDFNYCTSNELILKNFFRYHCSSLEELSLLGRCHLGGSLYKVLRNVKRLSIEEYANFRNDVRQIEANNPSIEIVLHNPSERPIDFGMYE